MLSLFTGLYSVPMYALIQLRAAPTHRARIIAANNILNALFMIASALLAGALLQAGFTVPQVFLAAGLANALVGAYIFLLVPEYLLRFVAWILSHLLYRFDVRGDDHIPVHGPAVLVCNHVSFVDALLLMGASPRPIRFVMDHQIFAIPVLGWLFRLAKAIPVASQKDSPQTYAAALEAAHAVLADGELLAIFPEGAITRDGTLGAFRGGVARIVARAREAGIDAPVIPMALTNLWGSFFSRIDGTAMTRPLRRGVRNRVGLRIGVAEPPGEVLPEQLRQRVQALMQPG